LRKELRVKKRVFIIILVAALGVALYFLLRPHPKPSDWVYGSGVFEATEVDVGAQVGGKLTSLRVDDGDTVTAGEVIATVEPVQYEAQVKQAVGALQAAEGGLAQAEATLAGAALTRANARENYAKSTALKGSYESARAQHEAAIAARDRAKAQLDLLLAGTRKEEIDQARAAVEATEADWSNAYRQLLRYEALLDQGAISQQQHDSQAATEKAARGARDAAAARLAEAIAGARTEDIQQAEAGLSQAEATVLVARRNLETAGQLYRDKLDLKQQLDSAESGYRAAEQAKVAAQGQVESATGTLAGARKYLKDTDIRAPLDAVVLFRIREAGETVAAAQPVVRLADIKHMWLRIYVPETEIDRVKLGQRAEVTIDAAPSKVFPGTVTEIAQQAEFTPKNVQTKEQRVKLVFGVKIEVENPEGELKPGMPADARVAVGARGGGG